MLAEVSQTLVRCDKSLEQLSFELEYMKHMYLAVFTDYSMYAFPFASEVLVNLYGELFNQNILFQEQQDYLCSLQSVREGIHLMSEDTKTEPENIDQVLAHASLDTTEVDEYTSAGSQKSISQYTPPEFTHAADEIIYATLKTTEGGMTRSELVEMTGIPRSTIYDSLQRLFMRSLVKRTPQHAGAVGRPKIYFESFLSSQVTT